MIEFERMGLEVPQGGVEVVEKRVMTGKTFLLPDGQFNLQMVASIIHYTDDGQAYDDVDLEPQDMGDHWFLTRAPYTLEIAKDRLECLYRSKKSGLEVHLALESIDGGKPDSIAGESKYHTNGHSLAFNNMLGDGHLSLVMKPGGMQTEQEILSKNGAKSLLWKITQNHHEPVVLETLRRAKDAQGRKAEITIARSSLLQKGSLWEHTFEEKITGNYLDTPDKKTRVQVSKKGAEYPIKVVS